MSQPVVLDEFHLTLFVPADLGMAQVRAARRLISRPKFRTRLVRAVRRLLDRSAATRPLTAEVSQ